LKPLLLAAVAVMLSVPVVAQSSAWQLDPPHSSAQFAVRHLGISTVRGTFTKLNGTARYHAADLKNRSVEITTDTASVDTRVEMRDNDLRSDPFLAVQKFPTMTFRSTKKESSDTDRLKIAGDLSKA
jgi:polyisoprenoid-binding protein YceI